MKALVIYGTRWGGTVGVAEKIAGALRQQEYVVDVCDARKAPSNIDLNDLAVVGSGVRADKWTDEALWFLEKKRCQTPTQENGSFRKLPNG
jgi:menaquinone-dependent protoporphyrinogen IX oxidase